MFRVPNQYRLRYGKMGSSDHYGNNGAFCIPLVQINSRLRGDAWVIASNGEGWEHVSVHCIDGGKVLTPSWEVLATIKDLFDEIGKLPADFMALPPHSNTDAVWDDVSRMHTLNSSQARRRQEKHTCPLQFDIVDRAIVRYSNKGDVVYDPFGGLMTVPFRCIELERFGLATELNEISYKDGVKYCKETEYKRSVPTLFDIEKIAV